MADCQSCDNEISQKLDQIAALLADLKRRVEVLENEEFEITIEGDRVVSIN